MNSEIGIDVGKNVRHVILNELLKQPMRFEKIIDKMEGKHCRGTVNKYLKELYDENFVELQVPTKYGKSGRMPYQIVASKRKQAEDEVLAYNNKHEITNLLDLATPQELVELSKFLTVLQPLYETIDHPEPGFLYWNKNTLDKKIKKINFLVQKLNTRKRVKTFQEGGAPEKVIAIGKKILSDEKINQTQYFLFNFYPMNAGEAEGTLSILNRKEDMKSTNYQRLAAFDYEIAELLAEKCNELLGRRPAKIPQRGLSKTGEIETKK
jgi:hypothetical protein